MAAWPRRRTVPTPARPERTSAAGAVLALQRQVGNSAATKLVEGAGRPEIDLDLPGIGEHIPVESFQIGKGGRHGEISDVSITRRVDASSPLFMRAAATGEPGTRATLEVGRPGSPRHLILRLQNCVVISYSPDGEWEQIGFWFTRADLQQ